VTRKAFAPFIVGLLGGSLAIAALMILARPINIILFLLVCAATAFVARLVDQQRRRHIE